MSILDTFAAELQDLKAQANFRSLPILRHRDAHITPKDSEELLNLSSNDYLGLACDRQLRAQFFAQLTENTFLPTSSSARLLTGNFTCYDKLEQTLANLFGTEAALVFNSGYHANTGILPAVTNSKSLILADKLVHASIIDGIRLSAAKCIRYRHNDYAQLERLIAQHANQYERVFLVTESIFSMDGDEADLLQLVAFKKRWPNVMLYVDEAHAFGVRGEKGLGCAEEQGCIQDIDFLVGTFGKAAASAGAYIVCKEVIRAYLINKMRTFIFTTALPPIVVAWTQFMVEQLPHLGAKRRHLAQLSLRLREALKQAGLPMPSTSHIVPYMVGDSELAVQKAKAIQKQGFYVLPVRPPTVPEGTSRIRISLTAAMCNEELDAFIKAILQLDENETNSK